MGTGPDLPAEDIITNPEMVEQLHDAQKSEAYSQNWKKRLLRLKSKH